MLFERLRGAGRRRRGAGEPESDSLLRSICLNLERLLNSRQGMSAACPDYGVPDLLEIVNGIPDRKRDIEGAIEKSIETFEPRLDEIRVRHVPSPQDPLSAHFHVSASLGSGKSKEQVWFETVVAASGRIRVTSRVSGG